MLTDDIEASESVRTGTCAPVLRVQWAVYAI